MGIFLMADKIMGVMFIIFIVMFIFAIVYMLSPKLRGKLMSRQVKSLKHMVDMSKDDLTDITSTMGNIGVSSAKNIIDNNEEGLRHISRKSADINKDAVEITSRAIKRGFSGNSSIYCKYCGEAIDSDSLFCKVCGKKQ